jgi:hypothetical protein
LLPTSPKYWWESTQSRIRDLEKTYPGSGSKGKKALDPGSGAATLLQIQTLIFLTFIPFFLYRDNFGLSESISHPDPGPKHCCGIKPEIVKFCYFYVILLRREYVDSYGTFSLFGSWNFNIYLCAYTGTV